MLNASHILETALLLLVAFLVGAVVGTSLRLLALRFAARQPAALTPSASVVAPPAAAAALVTAPAIAPLAPSAPPTAPEMVPQLDFAETMRILAGQQPNDGPAEVDVEVKEMRPARRAGETTSGRVVPLRKPPAVAVGTLVGEPAVPETLSSAAESQGMDAIAAPPPSSLDAPVDTLPAVAPGLELLAELQALLPEAVGTQPAPATEAEPSPIEPDLVVVVTSDIVPDDWSGSGPESAPPETSIASAVHSSAEYPAADMSVPLVLEAVDHDPVATEQSSPAQPEPPSEDAFEIAPDLSVQEAAIEVAELALVEAVVADVPAEPETETPSTPLDSAPAMTGSEPDEEEAAAMRAIEGNWSPQRKKTPTRRPVVDHDVGSAIEAAGTAVAAATRLAEATVAELQREETAEASRPTGIAAPHHGMRDDLTQVIGVLPIIETALNKLGIFHFDQLTEWSETDIAWIEEHLGIQGRIGREQWQEQARALASVSPGSKAAKQR